MKVLVTGCKGQLGYDVILALNKRNIECLGVDLDDFDITDYESTLHFIATYHPDAVIHCAAYTAVDRAEESPSLCQAVNEHGTRHIALACKEIDASLLYLSTDYVFPGTGEQPYETYSATAPLSQYGKSKLAGEKVIQSILTRYFIVRISWVFGKNGNNFVNTMLRLQKEYSKISVVSDQIGSPTYTYDLADLLCDMVLTEQYGIYHATNEGYCSWAEFAEEIFRLTNSAATVTPISSLEYPAKAMRPLNSRLSKKSLDDAGFQRLPHWKDALRRFLEED